MNTSPRTSTALGAAYRLLHPRVALAEEPPPPRRHTVTRWLSGFLVGALGTLLAAQLLMEACDLRFCQPFRHEHMHKVRFFQVEVPSVDVVYLGSSQVHFGVMPEVITQMALQQGVDLGAQYNLGVPGAELEVSHILARDTLQGAKRPRLLVLGVMPVLLAVDEGTPELVSRYGSVGDIGRLVGEGELPPEALVSAGFRGMEVLLQYPFYNLRRPVRAFRWEHLRRGQGCWWRPEDVATTVPPTADAWDRVYDAFGAPKPLYFHDRSRGARALLALRDLAAERDIELLAVYLPQHPRLFQRKFAPGSQERYGRWMIEFAAREGIHYVDLSEPEHYTADDYLDPMHLNAHGAEKFSRRLAESILK